jgi:hexosaminidase
MKKIFLVLFVCFSIAADAQKDPYMGIIPAPVSVKKGKGEFRLTSETLIFADSPSHKAARFFGDWLRKSGYGNSITDMNQLGKNQRGMKNTINLTVNFKGELPPEGYELYITEDNVTINGRGAGLFYGVQTLIQLMHTKSVGIAAIPCGTIKDYPRFGYRGMHLDVARHFFDIDFIKKYIDVMAAYKLNTFHWHLTDDQGWRIEIKKFPKLTEVGSKRAQTKIGSQSNGDPELFDNTPYGGFYTQDQVREIVTYASDRFITVVPEIEMPGHSLAAIASYPEMSCDPTKAYKVGERWGVYNDVYCPSEETFKMLNSILLEVMELFPGKYIHIGGDECPKEAWKKSDFCKQLMADKGIKDYEALQSYFISRIEQFVNTQGHSIIGWDEILEGGLAPNATVMSWRGEAGGIKAAQQNHDVIMTPGSGGLYFDHTQSYKSPQEPLTIGGNAPLSKTYAYDPVPASLTKEQQKHIIGVQANMWTEYMATPAKVEYMLLPRLLALSEVAWTQKDNKDFKNFSETRVARHLSMLDAMGYDYRVPTAIGAHDTAVTGSSFTIDLIPPVEGAKIYYTIDGYTPRETDLQYTLPFEITVPSKKTIEFKTIVITPSGKRSIVTDMKMTGK